MGKINPDKINRLRSLLREMKKVMIAFSGGVDSTFLLKVAADELGENVLAVIAVSPLYPAWEKQEAEQLATRIGVPYQLITVDEAGLQNIAHNPPDRCYHCKRIIFGKFRQLAEEKGFTYLLDGSNYDDLQDYRPGMVALQDMKVRSPLREAQLTKEEIRFWSRELGLPTWEKTSFACLATRIPYGTPITSEKLTQIDRGEDLLRSRGLQQFRLRHHGEIARLEINPEEFSLLWSHKEDIVTQLKNLGFTYVTLDLEGYRTGSMNETLTDNEKQL